MCAPQRGEGHGGGIGFDQEAVGRNVAESIQLAGTACVEEVTVEGEVGAEIGEGFDEFGRAAVSMEKKAARRQRRRGTKRVVKGTPGAEAVDRGGTNMRGGEGELGAKDIALFLQGSAAQTNEARIVWAGAVSHPAIEADLADGG